MANAEPSTDDLLAHERSYLGFVGLFKWGAITAILVAALVIYLISR